MPTYDDRDHWSQNVSKWCIKVYCRILIQYSMLKGLGDSKHLWCTVEKKIMLALISHLGLGHVTMG